MNKNNKNVLTNLFGICKVNDLYINTRIRSPFDVLPKHQTKLNKTNDHNPLTNENHGYVSQEMFTCFCYV